MEIDGLRLEGGGACPEQYEVFRGDQQVGYLRLRHGSFTVSYPDVGGEIIFQALPDGDGEFEDDERQHHLKAAVHAILDRIALGKMGPLIDGSADFDPKELSDLTRNHDGSYMGNGETVHISAALLRAFASQMARSESTWNAVLRSSRNNTYNRKRSN